MAYTIIKTNGTVLTTIADGTVNNTSTSLDLPGRNYAGYGVVMDTNLVHLLENFADSNVPQNPIRGQIWYNTATQSLYICPSDGETNINNWFKVLTANNTTIDSLTISGDIYANNVYSTNKVNSNIANTNYLNVFQGANLLGAISIPDVTTNNITAGSTTGNLIGNWSVSGNLSSLGIKTDNYYYANGLSINLEQAAGSTNEIQYNIGGTLSASSNLTFDPATDSLIVNGNVNADQFIGNGIGLTDVEASNITGILPTAVQSNITTLGTLSSIGVTGTVTAGNISVGNITASGNVTATRLAGSLTTSSQPNITSLGTLTGLTSTGIVYFLNTSSVQLGQVANLKILGGTNGYLLSTNGSGDVSFVNPATLNTAANGSNTQLQFNNNGVLGASSNLTYNTDTRILTVNGNIVSNNANLGNLARANFFQGNGYNLSSIRGSNIVDQAPNALVAGTVYTSAQPNITSLGTLTSLSVNGILNSSDAIISGNVSSNNFSGNTANLTTVNLTGNINSANALLGNTATASYFVGNGSKLTNINAANVVGTVSNAVSAVSATNGIPSGGIIMWSGSVVSIPVGWYLCNGSNGTPNLTDKFVIGAGNAYSVGNTGGFSNSVLLNHSHSFSGNSGSNGTHSHTVNDPTHSHIYPGDDQLVFAQGVADWPGTSAAGFSYDASSRGAGGGQLWYTTSSVTGIYLSAAANHTHSYSGSTSTVGTSNGVDTNLPPYYALCFIMKA